MCENRTKKRMKIKQIWW